MTSQPPLPLSLDEIALALTPFGVELSVVQMEAIRRYVEILLLWNQSVSLTSVEDPAEIVARHFGESIFAASTLDIRDGRLADVGTGAGFPGLPLKIANPLISLTLIEANQKKCAFLTEICSSLGLTGVEVLRSRYEDVSRENGNFDVICSRALGGYKQVLRWAKRVLAPNGRVILWLGVEDSILLGRTKGWTWDLPVKIPESHSRVILSGHPSDDKIIE